MKWKEYFATGIAALFTLTGCLLSIDTQSVKVKTSGKSVEFQSLEEIGYALIEFAPYMNLSSAILIPGIEMTDVNSDIEEMPIIQADDNRKYSSAMITVEGISGGENELQYEIGTYYISTEAVYAVFEGIKAQGVNSTINADNNFISKYLAYRSEYYWDRDREYSLMRVSDSLQMEEIAIEEMKTHKFEMINIPVGLQANVWYDINELRLNGYELLYSTLCPFGVFEVGKSILSNGEKFEGYGPNTLVNNQWYTAFINEMYKYSWEEKIGTLPAWGEITVYKNEEKCPIVNYELSTVNIKITLQNVNATVVKKMKNPKIGSIDINAYLNLQ